MLMVHLRESVGTPDFICNIFNLEPYTAKLSFAGYWKNVDNEAEYLKQSTVLGKRVSDT